MNVLLSKLTDEFEGLKASLDAMTDKVAEENRDFDSAEEANLNEGAAKLEALKARIDKLTAMELRSADVAETVAKVETRSAGKVARVGRITEPATYREDNEREVNFLSDLYASTVMRSWDATERLHRHAQEMATENRADTQSSFAGLIVPTYLTARYAPVAHEGRPVANVMNRAEPLNGRSSIIITKGTQDVNTDVQATENTTVATQDVTNTNVTVNPMTVSGYVDVSRQALELNGGTASPMSILSRQLYLHYAQRVDRKVLNGAGSGGEIKGLLNASGTNSVSGSGVSATANATNFNAFIDAVIDAKTAVRKSFVGNANTIIMSSGTWAWLQKGQDSTGRKLLPLQGPFNVNGDVNQLSFEGLSVVIDDNFEIEATPANKVIVLNTEYAYLFEDNGGAPYTISVEQTLAHQLSVRFVAYGYTAFTAEIYPKSVSIITGLPYFD